MLGLLRVPRTHVLPTADDMSRGRGGPNPPVDVPYTLPRRRRWIVKCVRGAALHQGGDVFVWVVQGARDHLKHGSRPPFLRLDGGEIKEDVGGRRPQQWPGIGQDSRLRGDLLKLTRRQPRGHVHGAGVAAWHAGCRHAVRDEPVRTTGEEGVRLRGQNLGPGRPRVGLECLIRHGCRGPRGVPEHSTSRRCTALRRNRGARTCPTVAIVAGLAAPPAAPHTRRRVTSNRLGGVTGSVTGGGLGGLVIGHCGRGADKQHSPDRDQGPGAAREDPRLPRGDAK